MLLVISKINQQVTHSRPVVDAEDRLLLYCSWIHVLRKQRLAFIAGDITECTVTTTGRFFVYTYASLVLMLMALMIMETGDRFPKT